MKKTFRYLLSSFALISLIACHGKTSSSQETSKSSDPIISSSSESEISSNSISSSEPEISSSSEISSSLEQSSSVPASSSIPTSSSASISSSSQVEQTFTVTWKNYDDTVLETDINVKAGEMPHYDGDTPQRANDESNSYTFSGWTPELTVVSQDITYTATFTSSPLPVCYHVTFFNYDDSLLYETDVLKGNDAIYGGETPTKEEDDEFTYEFDGWDQDLTNIQSDVTTKAKFKEVAKEGWGEIHW